MLTVYGRTTSINVQKAMWAIGELGLDHERLDVGGPFGGLDTPEFGAMNPNRLIPVLKDGDLTIWESNAIVRYLADRYGADSLSPSTEADRAHADQWMDWSITTFYGPLILGIFWSYIRIPAAERDMTAVAENVNKATNAVGVLDAHLAGRDFIVGNSLTTADIAVGGLLYRYFELPIDRPDTPNVTRYYQALCQRPAYQQHVMVDFQGLKVPGA